LEKTSKGEKIMRELTSADGVVSVVKMKGSGKGFAAEVEVRGNVVILHPVPRAYSGVMRDGDIWYGELADELKEVGLNPGSRRRIFVQPFIPIKRAKSGTSVTPIMPKIRDRNNRHRRYRESQERVAA
jgi:hypothetical protein